MKNKTKKSIIKAVTLGSVVTPLATVVSCATWSSTSEEDTKKGVPGGLTPQQQISKDKETINGVVNPDLRLPTPNIQTKATSIRKPSSFTLKNGVQVSFTNWNQDDEGGTITWGVELSLHTITRTIDGVLAGYEASDPLHAAKGLAISKIPALPAKNDEAHSSSLFLPVSEAREHLISEIEGVSVPGKVDATANGPAFVAYNDAINKYTSSTGTDQESVVNTGASDLNLPSGVANALSSTASKPNDGETSHGVHYVFNTWTQGDGTIDWSVTLTKGTASSRTLAGTIHGFQTEEQHQAAAAAQEQQDDTNLINGVVKENLNLPQADGTRLPSEISQPADGTTSSGVSYAFTTWTANDGVGSIAWTIHLTKDQGTARDLSGTVTGFQTTTQKTAATQSQLEAAKTRAIAAINTNTPAKDVINHGTAEYQAMMSARAALIAKINTATTTAEVSAFASTGTEFEALVNAKSAYANSSGTPISLATITTFKVTETTIDGHDFKTYDNGITKINLDVDSIASKFYGNDDVAKMYVEEFAKLTDFDASLNFFKDGITLKDAGNSVGFKEIPINYGNRDFTSGPNPEFGHYSTNINPQGPMTDTGIDEARFNTFGEDVQRTILRQYAANSVFILKAWQIQLNELLYNAAKMSGNSEATAIWTSALSDSKVPEFIRTMIMGSNEVSANKLLRAGFVLTLLNGASDGANSTALASVFTTNKYAKLNIYRSLLNISSGEITTLIDNIKGLSSDDFNNLYDYLYQNLMGQDQAFASTAFDTRNLSGGTYGHLVIANKNVDLSSFELRIDDYYGEGVKSLGGVHNMETKTSYYPVANGRTTTNRQIRTYRYFCNFWPTQPIFGSENGYVNNNYYTWYFTDSNGSDVDVTSYMHLNAIFKGEYNGGHGNEKIILNELKYSTSSTLSRTENGHLMSKNANLA